MENSFRLIIAFIAFSSVGFVILFRLLGISAMALAVSGYEFGKLGGPIAGLLLSTAILITISIIPALVLKNQLGSLTNKEFLSLVKRKNKKIGAMILAGLLVSLLIVFPFSLFLMPRLTQVDKTVAAFVAENRNESLRDYTANLTVFLYNNLHSSYNKPEGLFEIDRQIGTALIDSWIMQIWGVTRTDLILYQGWGSCGQLAIAIQQLLHDSGYETRRAHFIGVDHEWTEVKDNGEWLIIDPWYIGNLVEIQTLKNLKPDFQKASGVEVQYYNGTMSDASNAHGY